MLRLFYKRNSKEVSANRGGRICSESLSQVTAGFGGQELIVSLLIPFGKDDHVHNDTYIGRQARGIGPGFGRSRTMLRQYEPDGFCEFVALYTGCFSSMESSVSARLDR